MSTKQSQQSSWAWDIFKQLFFGLLIVASVLIVVGFSVDLSTYSPTDYSNRFKNENSDGATANAVEFLARKYAPPAMLVTNLLLLVIVFELRWIGTRLDEVADAEPKPPAFAMPVYQVQPPQVAQMPAVPTRRP